MQISGTPDNSALGYTTNAGDTHTEGIELELVTRPLKGLDLSLGGSLLEAELDEPAEGGAPGNRLPHTVEEMFFVSAQQRFPLTTRISGLVRGDIQYRGDAFSDVRNRPRTTPTPTRWATSTSASRSGASRRPRTGATWATSAASWCASTRASTSTATSRRRWGSPSASTARRIAGPLDSERVEIRRDLLGGAALAGGADRALDQGLAPEAGDVAMDEDGVGL